MEHLEHGGSFHLVLKPSWSKEFSTHRQFLRSSENQPYVDYIQNPFHSVGLSCQETDSLQGNRTRHFGVEEDGEESGDESEDETNSAEDLGEDEASHAPDIVIQEENVVKIFMKGLDDHDQTLLPYFNQAELVAAFCEEAKLETLRLHNPGAEATSLLYDDNNGAAQSIRRRQRKRLYGELTPHQLYEELKTEVR